MWKLDALNKASFTFEIYQEAFKFFVDNEV